MPSNGFVSLVGAGPGDPGLLTLRGAEALAAADVVVYDYLANPALLQRARPDAAVVYVGKKAGCHAMAQDQINALLVTEAQAGRRVVRLKGGDPFVFGRGGEEALALAAAGIPFDVVPGVSSAVAAPAYAGIPVTHRGVAASVAVVAGHEDASREESALNWAGLATGVDTLVFLMGVGNLAHLAEQLMRHGRAAETPVALISWGTLPRQKTVTGTLADIAARAEAAGIRPPAVTIVGDVVSLRGQLRWFDDRPLPLAGQRVLVTRSREQASVLSARLSSLGAEAVELPALRVAPPDDCGPLDRAVAHVGEYDWLVLTSVNGVAAFWERLMLSGRDARALAGVKVAAIGPATGAALESRGIRPDLVPDEYVAEAIVAGMGDVRGQRVLLARADIARPALADLLQSAGAEVTEVTAYRTLHPAGEVYGLRDLLAGVTVATFTSSSTVRNLAAMARESDIDLSAALDHATIACIGPITADSARAAGLQVHIMADTYTIDGLVSAIQAYFLDQPETDLQT